ncbi:LAME_0H10440g1_1 [Lachancea meyersii CBS 8951]|uniref:LAME_0H10440g1_1 n=1 Tax=Lachancea meyersii CBS 8951 TaxID=1266667 RepID=A0A1G4KFU9_9SACH|nr:LAME_0H10440g1_1 [Lachancea meyersii CBS 8951]
MPSTKLTTRATRPAKRARRSARKPSLRQNATRVSDATRVSGCNNDSFESHGAKPGQTAAPENPPQLNSPSVPAPLSSPSFMDDYLHWDHVDRTAEAPQAPPAAAASMAHSLLLVHTQPVHSVSVSLLHDTLDLLDAQDSQSRSPSFSAFSDPDQLLDSLPEPTAADHDVSKVPRNPPLPLQHLTEVAMNACPEPPVLSPEDSFVQYLSHKLSRYCGYVSSDSHYCDKIRLQEISYRLSKTTFER